MAKTKSNWILALCIAAAIALSLALWMNHHPRVAQLDNKAVHFERLGKKWQAYAETVKRFLSSRRSAVSFLPQTQPLSSAYRLSQAV